MCYFGMGQECRRLTFNDTVRIYYGDYQWLCLSVGGTKWPNSDSSQGSDSRGWSGDRSLQPPGRGRFEYQRCRLPIGGNICSCSRPDNREDECSEASSQDYLYVLNGRPGGRYRTEEWYWTRSGPVHWRFPLHQAAVYLGGWRLGIHAPVIYDAQTYGVKID